MAGERSARRRMTTFVIAIFLAACALGAIYLLAGHPGETTALPAASSTQ